jgi:hypothetical protein
MLFPKDNNNRLSASLANSDFQAIPARNSAQRIIRREQIQRQRKVIKQQLIELQRLINELRAEHKRGQSPATLLREIGTNANYKKLHTWLRKTSQRVCEKRTACSNTRVITKVEKLIFESMLQENVPSVYQRKAFHRVIRDQIDYVISVETNAVEARL